MSSVLKGGSLTPWTTREVPEGLFYKGTNPKNFQGLTSNVIPSHWGLFQHMNYFFGVGHKYLVHCAFLDTFNHFYMHTHKINHYRFISEIYHGYVLILVHLDLCHYFE